MLRRHRKFLIFGHVEPDGDCVASQLVLAEFLRRRGRQAEVFSEGPFDRPETVEFRGRFRRELGPQDLEGGAVAVVMDCSTPERVGAFAGAIEGLPTVVIDHHASGREFGSIRWVTPRAAATSLLVQRLIERFPGTPSAAEAELLLFGLATDTGFFRHLEADSKEVFSAVSRLTAAGASPRSVYGRMHGGRSLAKVHLLAKNLEQARFELGGRVLLTSQSLEDVRGGEGTSPQGPTRGSDEAYRILQSVEGVEVVVFVREEAAGRCAVGLRSNGEVDVGALAAELGGGGHRRAAGYTFPGTVGEAETRLLAALQGRLR